MSNLQRHKSVNLKISRKTAAEISPQMSQNRKTVQSPSYLAELENNRHFLNQKEKLGYAEKRKSMSLGDLPLKEMGFFEKLSSKLGKSRSMNVKNVDQNALIQKYRRKDRQEEVSYESFLSCFMKLLFGIELIEECRGN